MQEQSIFIEALEKEQPAERAAFLERVCAADPVLRQRIERLLEQHGQAGSFLESPPPHLVATTLEAGPGVSPGTVIGAYKLMEQIGEGGMGLVFVAEQQEPIRRKVALKVIKPGMDSREVVARFEAERQALALMDHPHIATVLDAGTTPSGRPYFVMELVKGVPITQYCDDNRLTPRERLQLFVPLCQAVQHAHTKGIIHRDIKPSNVLVTLHDITPVVKVIDFGVAKAVGRQLTENTVYTGFTQMIGTPLYMSPEQAQLSGLDVDTRSDMYSLGVLLYELLTGTTPFDRAQLHQAGYDEIRRLIREEEPARPSTRVSTLGQAGATVSANRKSDPLRLSHLLRGELDWIVMKSLEKDRNRRYETASAFAADVHRYLNDEPVQACPPSRWYRFGKFARRHKAGLMATASMVVAVLLAVGGLVAGNAQIKREQQQTQVALERERDTNEDLTRSLEREARVLYRQGIQLADRELEANNVGRAEELLDFECPVRLRDWEWQYLKRRRFREPLTFRGHNDYVWHLAFSPDGKQVASASSFLLLGVVKIWDPATGKVIRTLRRHFGPVIGVAYSPDGKRFATASWDKTAMVWDTSTWRVLHTLRHTEYTSGVAFSPDSTNIATASGDRTAKIWDAATGQLLRTLHGHARGLSRVVYSPDGRTLATAASDKTVRLWDAATGKEVRTLRGHTSLVYDVAFSQDGRRLASAALEGTVKVWEPATGKEVRTLRVDYLTVTSVAFSRDGRRLASASLDKTVKLWDVDSGQEVLTLRGHEDLVTFVTFSPDGRQLASASLDRTVKVWDSTPVTGKLPSELLTLRGHILPVIDVVFSPDSKQLVSGSLDGTVRLWDAASGDEVRILAGHSGPVYVVAVSRDGKRLASADFGGTIKVWDRATGKDVRTFQGFYMGMAFSPDGRRLAANLDGGTVRLWDATTGQEELTLPASGVPLTGLAFSPDGKRLATASWDGTAKIWDAATGRELLAVRGHRHLVQMVRFSPDGKRLATASWDKTAKVWDADTGKEVFAPLVHGDRVLSVAFSPDGKLLATASYGHTVKVWDGASGKELLTLRGHNTNVASVAFSPNGKRLASGGGFRGHGEIKTWDTTGWRPKPSTP